MTDINLPAIVFSLRKLSMVARGPARVGMGRGSRQAIPPIGALDTLPEFAVQGPDGIAQLHAVGVPLTTIRQGFRIGRPGGVE